MEKPIEGFRDAYLSELGIVSRTLSLAFGQGIVDRLNALGFQFTDIVDVLKDSMGWFLARSSLPYSRECLTILQIFSPQ